MERIEGYVSKVKGTFCWIKSGRDFYFLHNTDWMGTISWEELTVGTQITFSPKMTDRGLRAEEAMEKD